MNNHGSSRTLEVADNVDFNIGRAHAMRVGLLFEGGSYDNFDARNAAGTFTFSNLESYRAGQPLQFTQRHRPGGHRVLSSISWGSTGRTTSA